MKILSFKFLLFLLLFLLNFLSVFQQSQNFIEAIMTTQKTEINNFYIKEYTKPKSKIVKIDILLRKMENEENPKISKYYKQDDYKRTEGAGLLTKSKRKTKSDFEEGNNEVINNELNTKVTEVDNNIHKLPGASYNSTQLFDFKLNKKGAINNKQNKKFRYKRDINKQQNKFSYNVNSKIPLNNDIICKLIREYNDIKEAIFQNSIREKKNEIKSKLAFAINSTFEKTINYTQTAFQNWGVLNDAKNDYFRILFNTLNIDKLHRYCYNCNLHGYLVNISQFDSIKNNTFLKIKLFHDKTEDHSKNKKHVILSDYVYENEFFFTFQFIDKPNCFYQLFSNNTTKNETKLECLNIENNFDEHINCYYDYQCTNNIERNFAEKKTILVILFLNYIFARSIR